MISPESFLAELKSSGVNFFCGVPDSLLKNLCSCVTASVDRNSHIITANEGNAVALAAGYHLATGKTGTVYMQNSGIGNAVNPLASLTDPEVYRIPVLLIIGWRGEPGVKDEPQHVKQGRISPALLDTMEIPYQILGPDSDYKECIAASIKSINEYGAPAAILVRKDTFSSYKSPAEKKVNSDMTREQAVQVILELAEDDDLFVSTTGKTSRELFELRKARGEAQRDFLTVGSMGHTSSIALGAALGAPGRRVICLDGDGSVIMHMGAIPIIGDIKPANLMHIVLNNASHESVGGQPTVADSIDFKGLALACGYTGYASADSPASIKSAWTEAEKTGGPVLMEIHIKQGSRDDLGRPSGTPEQNKKSFMEHAGVR
jgi:phosphonopyruvate decarboxylase